MSCIEEKTASLESEASLRRGAGARPRESHWGEVIGRKVPHYLGGKLTSCRCGGESHRLGGESRQGTTLLGRRRREDEDKHQRLMGGHHSMSERGIERPQLSFEGLRHVYKWPFRLSGLARHGPELGTARIDWARHGTPRPSGRAEPGAVPDRRPGMACS